MAKIEGKEAKFFSKIYQGHIMIWFGKKNLKLSHDCVPLSVRPVHACFFMRMLSIRISFLMIRLSARISCSAFV
jgi:hypothetical protein